MSAHPKLARLHLQSRSPVGEVPEPNPLWERRAAGMLASAHSLRGSQEWDRSPSGLRSLARRGFVAVPADRIHKAVVEALAPGAIGLPSVGERQGEARSGPVAGGAYPFASGRIGNRIEGRIAVAGTLDLSLQTLLEQSPALLLKAHHALWARLYAETDAEPGDSAILTLPELCDDLEYARLANGAHRPERKRQALAAVRALAALELDAVYRAPNGATVHLHGPLWVWETVSPWRVDGASPISLGDPAARGSIAFRYSPGPWYAEPEWRRHNHFIALLAEGFLGLDPADRDKWAVILGSILAPLSRLNRYQPHRLRVTYLLERTGLLRADRRNPGRALDKLERALDRLREVGVIDAWEYAGTPTGEPDMDDPAALARLVDAGVRPRDRQILLRWPADLAARFARRPKERGAPGKRPTHS